MARGGRSARVADLSWAVRTEGRSLWSRNAVPGVAVRGERLKRRRGEEWRQWSPRRSKLAAGLLRLEGDKGSLLPEPGTTTLYLGAGHGTTISYLHDHLCGAQNERGGCIVAVDISPRCMRDLVRLAEARPGLVPVLADARHHEAIAPFLPARVRWLFQDVSQAGQVDMHIAAAQRFLAPNGLSLLSLKSASERSEHGGRGVPRDHYDHARAALTDAGAEVLEVIELTGWEEQHALIVSRMPEEWGKT